MENDELQVFQTKDVMEYLKISKEKANALRRSNCFPPTRIGKTYIVTKKSFMIWLDDNAGKNIVL